MCRSRQPSRHRPAPSASRSAFPVDPECSTPAPNPRSTSCPPSIEFVSRLRICPSRVSSAILHRRQLPEQQRAVIQKSHHHSAIHGIDIRRAVLRRLNLPQRHLFQHCLHGKRPRSHANSLHSLLRGAERGKRQRVHILIRIDPDALQRRPQTPSDCPAALLFQLHGRRGILQRPVIHRNQLLQIRGNHRSRRRIQRHRIRRFPPKSSPALLQR